MFMLLPRTYQSCAKCCGIDDEFGKDFWESSWEMGDDELTAYGYTSSTTLTSYLGSHRRSTQAFLMTPNGSWEEALEMRSKWFTGDEVGEFIVMCLRTAT